MRILLVEDDSILAEELSDFLEDKGFDVDIAKNKREVIYFFKNRQYDLFILDVGLPDASGFSLCSMIRNECLQPIIMLTAYDSENDIVTGLESGADDYITKPCSLRILQSRINTQLRRKEWFDRKDICCLKSGGLVIDVIHHMVQREGIELYLGDTEFKLCVALAKSDGRIMPRELLLDRIWDQNEKFIEDNTLSVHISRLRKKLGMYDGEMYIDTVKGIGYRWNFPVKRDYI